MNSCGDCQVCCVILRINDLKDGMIKCQHQTVKGCGVYKERPNDCSYFQCGYISENWGMDKRPDISGVMVLATKDGIEAYRIKDKVNNELFEYIKDKKVRGYDCRKLFN